MTDLRGIWVYLSASPLLHLTLTLVAFQAGAWLYKRGGMNPLLNPVMIAVVLIVAVLALTSRRSRQPMGHPAQAASIKG